MTPTIVRNSRLAATRRGVTLVEMLVTVAVLVIIMTVLVQIFQAATGALTTAQIIQDLDNQLKLLESTIRSDLGGVTARFTPALDPTQGLGYFEYGENEFPDTQGEDSDDFLRFTAKAPPGQPFTGRRWVTAPANAAGFYNGNAQPITVTSEYAEIIYFLRNGNLYRRVLLIAPELQSAIVPTVGNQGFLPSPPYNANGSPFTPGSLGGSVPVSWQGVNDFSAHPAATGPNTTVSVAATAFAAQTVVLNTLSSLTNRENRYAAPRFSDDFLTIAVVGANTTFNTGPDAYSDDVNADKVPDLYPSLYAGAYSSGLVFAPPTSVANPFVGAQAISKNNPGVAFLAFPYMFPGAYTQPQIVSADQYGWIHSPSPYANVIQSDGFGQGVMFETNPLAYLQSLNHNPLDLADNLPTPATPLITHGNITANQMLQTWWGFSDLAGDALGALERSDQAGERPFGVRCECELVWPAQRALAPPDGHGAGYVGQPASALDGSSAHSTQGGLFPNGYDFSIIRQKSAAFQRRQGYSGNMSIFLGTGGAVDGVWAVSWEDDLVMTNVRSFDVKAYDNALAGYGDLGWGDDLRLYVPYQNDQGFNPQGLVLTSPPYLNQTPNVNGIPAPTIWPPVLAGGGYDTINQTFAHEGRMPPITNDLRFDAQFGAAANYLPGGTTSPWLTANNGPYNNGNIGDDRPGIGRLRKVPAGRRLTRWRLPTGSITRRAF